MPTKTTHYHARTKSGAFTRRRYRDGQAAARTTKRAGYDTPVLVWPDAGCPICAQQRSAP